jgi:predicted GIY-YIG superfamily endonuclease
MWYVYIIRSIEFPDQEYTGATADLKRRIADHNAGKSIHTANTNRGNWSGTALFQTSTERWNSRNISNLTPAGHLRRSVSDA